ncbi:DUF1294 domain-containing protein [Alkalibacterium sp. MB6]|uniref:DUF1294 domain-containing protein n=1 Tax=Alkalibacterium sp. MB6 TaxID=2081965 RepID=UPI00137A79B2|nr:DUF1294 domain-containing protein [Alkalibacterium sp. MB6]
MPHVFINIKNCLVLIIILLNTIAYILFYIDKQRARKNQYRLSEKKLFMASFALGGVGAWIAMWQFRHKTKHKPFVYGIPLAAFITLSVTLLILSI